MKHVAVVWPHGKIAGEVAVSNGRLLSPEKGAFSLDETGTRAGRYHR